MTEARERQGCEGCEKEGSWWFHLRRCAECGYIGCCDSSPKQHATNHARQTGHQLACSFEPGESWCWNYATEDYAEPPSPEIAAMHHPRGQAVPGPSERVPEDWQQQLQQ